jgi:hypothetical protein
MDHGRFLGQVRMDQFERIGRRERKTAGQQLMENDPEGVQIRGKNHSVADALVCSGEVYDRVSLTKERS